MMKQYTLSKQSKAGDFPFSIDILEHDYEVPVHVHDCTELVIILAGKSVHIVDNQEYQLKAGDVFIVNSGSEHGYKDVHRLELANLMFDYGRLVDRDTELKQLPGFQILFILEPFFRKDHKFQSRLELNPKSLNFVKELLDKLAKEYEEQTSGFKQVIQAYFLTLIAYLSRQYSENKNIASSKLISLSNAITYMESNYLGPINISSVAAIAYLSTRQFTRIFKSNFAMSPKEYIIWLRFNYACKLMRSSNLNISQIAMESGFSDISFFSRQFKNKFGISPKEYRKSV
jgi:AraC-like DNA-binding protein